MRVTEFFEGSAVEMQAAIGTETREETNILLNSEHSLGLYAEERLLHSFLCSPRDLGELCVGWLLSEGYGGEAVEISADGHRATVAGAAALPAPPEPLTCSAPAAHPGELLKLFQAGAEAHARTHGVHECVITGAGWCIRRTDIGRHNAIDKALGAAVLAGYDLTGASLFTSGRINTQTVQKAARLRIGCLLSKAVITGEALALAQQLKLPTCFCVKEGTHCRVRPLD